MKVVNFFASPGSGKSTTASGLFYNLKTSGFNAELAGEYAKDLTWARRFLDLEDQLYIFGKQHHRLFRLQHDCDVAIVDSPLLLSLIYAPKYPQCFRDTVKWAFDQYDNINFVVNRVKPYNPKGRRQSEDESREKHEEILNLLTEFGIHHYQVNGDEQGLKTVTEIVKQKIT
jgi:nicotinamide riboside kinase